MWPALIAGAASLYGTYQQNKENEASAQRQMDFQREMSNTSHQREVADLRKAGLNPILSANGGASTPTGSSYQAQNPLEKGLTSAAEMQGVENAGKKLTSDMSVNDALKALYNTQRGESAARQSNINMDTATKAAMLPSVSSTSALNVKRNTIDDMLLEVDAGLDRGSKLFNMVPNFKNLLRPNKSIPKGHGTFDKKTGEIFP